MVSLFKFIILSTLAVTTVGFAPNVGLIGKQSLEKTFQTVRLSPISTSSNIVRKVLSVDSVEEASRLLADWDKMYNEEASQTKETLSDAEKPDKTAGNVVNEKRELLAPAVRLLSDTAAEERNQNAAKGRCMLGICASSAEEGIAALKSWVTELELPRGLLHGMDKDGVPLELDGGVYIKYNTGGVYTFADIRKSGMGFDALWKPGDALLEPYDGNYRGVYFQVELADEEFRQYLLPVDIF